ncbi:MAG: HsdR family type I site-specific deoxyribonuclease [Candidatus Parvarchaeota archaeon]|nr:HsdR family type I site-specific deoxyribonuclease [Candidatus Parvarchaeota archaeon]
MLIGNERPAVQDQIIKYAKEIGWQYLDKEEALRLRGGETGLILKEVFEKQMVKLNSDFIDGNMIQDLIKRIETAMPNIKGNLVVWEHLRGLKSIFVPEERRERNVQFIDFSNIQRNTFHVTEEFSYTNGRYRNRPDIVFFINGIPTLIVETKAANKLEAISMSFDQIRRYHEETPELMTVMQSFQLTDLIRFFYGPTWNTSRTALLNWKEEQSGNFESLVKSFFEKARTIKLIEDFILFPEKDGELKKVIFRPHQMRAVNKIYVRAGSNKKRGLIWHTQGSGKTYTMIVAAKKLILDPTFNNPTIIMVVDRNELESQLFNNLAAVGFGNIVVAETKEHLQRLVKEEHRGLIVTIIHKFEGMPPKICMNKNIYVLIDEAHRSTQGKFGNYMMGAIPNATYIGFTGTPVMRTFKGTNTFTIFGRDDKNGYLDKYGIKESIEDGTTVPLKYSIASNKLLVKRGVLEKEFLSLKEAEGVSDVEELNSVLRKQVTLCNMLKNEVRVKKIAEFVANHFKSNVEPLGYKAFLVTVDREACVMYKKALDKFLPKDYSEVIMSSFYEDAVEMKAFHKTEEEEKVVRKKFQNPVDKPKILIVTDKLLTGFDAPILYCMYLDKPMRDHVLLQAIARINRPYEENGHKKICGLVIDFIGLFGNLKSALAFDSKDVNDIEAVVQDLEILKLRYSKLMSTVKLAYLKPINAYSRDKAVEYILKIFADEKERQKFFEIYEELKDIYEILSPDDFLRDYLDDQENLARIYRILKEAFGTGFSPDKDFGRKTANLVRRQTTSTKLPEKLSTYDINEHTLQTLASIKASEEEKVYNLLVSVRAFVLDNIASAPYLLSIGERAQQIAKAHNDNLLSTKDSLTKMKDLVTEINSAKHSQNERGFNTQAFTVYWILKQKTINKSEDVAVLFNKLSVGFPHWQTNPKQERIIKRELIKELLSRNIEPGEAASIIKEIVNTLKLGR